MSSAKMYFYATVLCLLSLVSYAAEPDTIKFARYPNIHNGKITFTYNSDIWVADEDGSNPYRLTDHVARDTFPRFSPDGQWIAFSSNRMGNYDIWLIPVRGGRAKQLTFHTADDFMVNWTPDGKRLIFRTSRNRAFYSPLYTVGIEGDVPMPLNIDMGSAGMFSQDGRYLAFNRKPFSYWRKHYRGNNSTDIWLQDMQTQKITRLTDTDLKNFRGHTHDVFPMWGCDGMIYFVSEKSGIFNIWKISISGGKPKQVTFHDKDGIQYPSISPDGKTIIYENDFELWKLNIPDGLPEKIPLSLGFEPKENLIDYLHVNSQADGFNSSPDGSYVSIDYHGEIFMVPSDPKVGEKKQITASAARDRFHAFSPNGKYLAYISDQSQEEEIWLHDLETGEKLQLTSHESTKKSFMWSADSKRIAFVAANRLFIVDVKTKELTELAYNQAQGFSLNDWSKDGKWFVYTRSIDDYNQDIYLFNIEQQKEYNITQNPFYDSNARFMPDGKHLVFASTRNGRHLFALPLSKVKEDINDPLLREKKLKSKKKSPNQPVQKTSPAAAFDPNSPDVQQPDSADDPNNPAEQVKPDTEKDSQPEKELVFDMEGIDRRAVQITRQSSDVRYIFVANSGDKIYYTAKDDKGQCLFSISIDGKDETKITEGTFDGLVVSADRKNIFYKQGANVYKMPLASKKKEKIDFTFTVPVDRQKEWEQIFEECWRVMKYYFYDENMHGFDWQAIKSTYKPLLKYIGENADLYDLTNEMIGELNASHTGVSGPSGELPKTYTTKYPGFEMIPDGSYYKINRIHWNGPADKEWVDISIGDCVISIDGKPVRAGDNYWTILNSTLNEYVTVEVNSQPSPEGARKVRIKTVPSIQDILYEEWVENNRKYVKEQTDDRIAYVHIRAMNQQCLERFKNEIDRYHNHKGIIIDIRYNGGGNIDQQLLDILSRRAYGYWNSRWASPEMGRRPIEAIIGPKVMLINWRSASDSEVTPMGFRDLGLGRIVGNPTYGAVIATGSYGLINGASIRTPGALVVNYDPTAPNNYGVNLENYGVEPDVWAENTPQDELAGFDRELKAAVDEALKMLNDRN